MSSSQLSSLLLEIGIEEIPARFLPPALSLLKERFEARFNEHSIDFSEIKTYSTPRRLAVIVHGIPEFQRDRIKEVFGPPKNAAFDKDGNPTRAAIGFANSLGLDPANLVLKKKDKGEYAAAVIEQKGISVREVLPGVLKEIILSLHFPKAMRWGSSSLRFARPIHWIVALLDSEVVPFEIDNIKSGNITKGHRFLSPAAVAIREIDSYTYLMENNYAIVDPVVRKGIIASGITGLASGIKGIPVMDEDLLDTVTHLVEYPVPVLCEFPPEYLTLPRELLVTVMKDHQKFFAIEDEAGKLRNHFIVISNTKEENSETIRTGAERVIKARFEDARFYYNEDLKKPLLARVEDLKKVTFHDRLGTLYDKADRLAKLASSLSERVCPEKKELTERAAWLSKADLITGIVSEFPELQGLMGKYYALQSGEQVETAEALMEQYLPPHSGGRLPATDAGAIISLSDKLDNIVSFFAINLLPTGSEDPFALRRQTLGAAAILMDRGYDITLRQAVMFAEENIKHRRPSLTEEVLVFFRQRIEQMLLAQDHESDIIQSMMPLMPDLPLAELRERLQAINRFSGTEGYNAMLLAMKRINNIIPDAAFPEPREELLSEVSEQVLYNSMINVRPLIQKMTKNRNYSEALGLLSSLIHPVNSFFDSVLVMDKNEEVKLNRLALLKALWETAIHICDFSKLTEKNQADAA